jgi:hypothetical protein
LSGIGVPSWRVGEQVARQISPFCTVPARLLFEDDRVSRVRWEAVTRKVYFDELPRITRSHREFAAAVAGRNE